MSTTHEPQCVLMAITERLFINTHFDLLRTIVASLGKCVYHWHQLRLAARYVTDVDLTFFTSLSGWVELKEMYFSYTGEVRSIS